MSRCVDIVDTCVQTLFTFTENCNVHTHVHVDDDVVDLIYTTYAGFSDNAQFYASDIPEEVSYLTELFPDITGALYIKFSYTSLHHKEIVYYTKARCKITWCLQCVV